MMVPRSYSYMASTRSSSPEYCEKNLGTRQLRPRSAPLERKERKETVKPGKPSPPTSTFTEPVHSKPVIIPPPNQPRAPVASQTLRSRGQHGWRRTNASSSAHKPNTIPPAVAALLAVTAIPPAKTTHPHRRRSRSGADRTISIDELVRSWREDDRHISSEGYGSPMDILLERPDELEHEDLDSAGGSSEERNLLASRSASSDSLTSIPSLRDDNQSLLSLSNPSTPGSVLKRSGTERKEKAVSSPSKEDCVLDHPLLYLPLEDAEDTVTVALSELEMPAKKVPSTTLKASFKSNLTASLQALKFAAKSFSNFTAPSVPPDDFLTRSLLSPRFASEMRPKPLQGVPAPALRRYLNPQTPARPVSRAELSSQLHEALLVGTTSFDGIDANAPMIQLQTYERRNSRSSSRRRRSPSSGSPSGAVDPQSEAGRALLGPAVRQREPRENSDFLRVIVLEMNMRREGKLDAKAMGKARVWLPPRTTGTAVVRDVSGRVPARWIGITVDDGY